MQIWVYAIAKNEAKFCRRWLESMSEADGIAILDTGSTDGTIEEITVWAKEKGWELSSSAPILSKRKTLVVKRKTISPWRFDNARNESLKLVPKYADVLLCMDLDEVILPGWRNKIEASWSSEYTTGRYDYVWSFNDDGSDGVIYAGEKIHAHGPIWKYPVHEVLQYSTQTKSCWLDIRVEHHPDHNKSRRQYLPLLELSVKESPDDDRNMHYLGREYMYYQRWEEAIETLTKHLSLPSATWVQERAASMMYIAKCHLALNNTDNAELWLLRASMESPGQREPFFELGKLMYEAKRWKECARYLDKCLAISTPDLSYLTNPQAWGGLPWDLLSIAWWHLKEYDHSIYCAKQALLYSDDERIKNNLKFFEKEVTETIKGE